MNKTSQKQKEVSWDEIDEKIERGEIDPPESGFYTAGVVSIINMAFEKKDFQRPRGKNMPTFTEAEMGLLLDYIFFKPKGWGAPRPFSKIKRTNL